MKPVGTLLLRSAALLTVGAALIAGTAIGENTEGQTAEPKKVVAAASDTADTGGTAPKQKAKDNQQKADTGLGGGVVSSPKSRGLFRYSRKGLEIGNKETLCRAKINGRSQLRYSTPFRSSPRRPGHFEREDEDDFRFRRARFKMEGHAFRPWIAYKFEEDLVNTLVLNARMTIKKLDWFQVRFGQWKIDYSRERSVSSGKQTFADRSIVNREFTPDRQKGVEFLGHVMKQTPGDSWYYVGVFSGNGRGLHTPRERKVDNEDGAPMWMARYQWNFLGRDLEYSSSDIEYGENGIEYHEKPTAALAFATVHNRGRYTLFSSSGGGQLDGFEAGLPGQYLLRQFMEETSFKYRGVALQHEFHWKRIFDRVNAEATYMRGSFLQAGYFFHNLIPTIPRQLEVATRYAFVDPNTHTGGDLRTERSFAVNWFFDGHANKLTFDTSRYSLDRIEGPGLSDRQFRLQWDVTF